MTIPLFPGSPPELVVYDRLTACPYLDGEIARLPLRMPTRDLTREEFDARLASGDRRQGVVLYRTACPRCNACEPIRLDVARFSESRSHRRSIARARRELGISLGATEADERRVELYNAHKRARGLDAGQQPIGLSHYEEFLGKTCCESFELRFHHQGELVGVAILDRAATALSAVYCYYDPAYARFGLGTLAVLLELELCRRWGLRHLYLGLYVPGCEAMEYKARFLPHERLLGGEWRAVHEHQAPEPRQRRDVVRLPLAKP